MPDCCCLIVAMRSLQFTLCAIDLSFLSLKFIAAFQPLSSTATFDALTPPVPFLSSMLVQLLPTLFISVFFHLLKISWQVPLLSLLEQVLQSLPLYLSLPVIV